MDALRQDVRFAWRALTVGAVTPELFGVLGVAAQAGRFFVAEEGWEERAPACRIVGLRLRKQLLVPRRVGLEQPVDFFGADPGVVALDARAALGLELPGPAAGQDPAPEGVGAALEGPRPVDGAALAGAVEDAVEVGALTEAHAAVEPPGMAAPQLLDRQAEMVRQPSGVLAAEPYHPRPVLSRTAVAALGTEAAEAHAAGVPALLRWPASGGTVVSGSGGGDLRQAGFPSAGFP